MEFINAILHIAAPFQEHRRIAVFRQKEGGKQPRRTTPYDHRGSEKRCGTGLNPKRNRGFGFDGAWDGHFLPVPEYHVYTKRESDRAFSGVNGASHNAETVDFRRVFAQFTRDNARQLGLGILIVANVQSM